MKKTMVRAAFVAALSGVALPASAARRVTLPNPPQVEYADTEGSVNIPITGFREDTRRLILSIAANASPTGCVQVAFGIDLNHDEDLEPGETERIVGNDCGEWFVRDEGTGAVEQGPGSGEFCLHDWQTFTRWDLMKVTTRGKGDLAPVIQMQFKNNPTIIYVK